MNKNTALLFAWIFISLFTCNIKASEKTTSSQADEELIIVKDGKSVAPIVIYKNAPNFTRGAAEELAEYMEKISGAKPEIIEGTPDPIPEHAIWVGYQPVLDDIFPDIDFDFKHPEEILLACNKKHVVIAGRDRWDTEVIDKPLFRKKIVGIQQEYGTANAVYTFMQDNLKVRWLWPGELGIDIIKQKTISIKPFEYRYHPVFRDRDGIFYIYVIQRQHKGHIWTRYQRLQLDSMDVPPGHGFTWWWQKYYKDHPEYFALQPDGTRGTWPGSLKGYRAGTYIKICKSNPKVWDLWLKEVEEQLKEDPYKTVFSASANDGGYEGYCVCDNCLAWDNPKGTKLCYRWVGLRRDYVAMSDRQVKFANILGKMLKKRYPDKDYYVNIMAYGNSRPAPAAEVPDDNVIVSGVFAFHNRSPILKRASFDNRTFNHLQLFLDWGKVTKNIYWRPNIGSAGSHRGYLNCAPHSVIKDFRMVAEHGTMGIFLDSIYGHWANQGPYYYMAAQMGWNPYADGEAILDDYYTRAFGSAKDTMEAYWSFIEKTVAKITFKGKSQDEVWNEDFYKEGYRLLEKAASEVDASSVYAKRIDFVLSGLDYQYLLKDCEMLMKRLVKSKGKDKEAEEKARANWEKLEKIASKNPYVFHWGYMKPGGSRSRGLHPDEVLSKYKKEDPMKGILGRE